MGRPKQHAIGWKGLHPQENNQFGFRGHDEFFAGEFRVILLGDSQVEGVDVFDRMPEVFLKRESERRLKRKVGVVTLGSGGYGQDQEYFALLQALQIFRPNVICLWFTPENDFWNNAFPTHFPKNGVPKPTFWLEGTELKGPNLDWLSMYDQRSLYLARLWDRIHNDLGNPKDEEWEHRLPAAYQLFPARKAEDLRNFLAHKRGVRPDEVLYFEGESFAMEKSHYSIYFTPRSPRTEYAATLTRALLSKIEKASSAQGIPFFLFRRELSGDIPEVATEFVTPEGAMMLSSHTANQLIDETLEGFDTVTLKDLAPDEFASRSDSHLGEKGNERAMKLVAEKILSLRGMFTQ